MSEKLPAEVSGVLIVIGVPVGVVLMAAIGGLIWWFG